MYLLTLDEAPSKFWYDYFSIISEILVEKMSYYKYRAFPTSSHA